MVWSYELIEHAIKSKEIEAKATLAPTKKTIPLNQSRKSLLRLLQNQLVTRVLMEPHKPPFPKWYDSNGHCDYHYGAQGHTIENCLFLKYKVQSLIKVSLLDFNGKNRPSVMANPLPNHASPNVNAIVEDSGIKVKTKVDEVKSSMEEVYKVLVKIWGYP